MVVVTVVVAVAVMVVVVLKVGSWVEGVRWSKSEVYVGSNLEMYEKKYRRFVVNTDVK